jgi:hypothetical protein
MQSRTPNYFFGINYNFGNESVFTCQSANYISTFPPVLGNFELLNNMQFLLLDGTNFLLL